MAWTNRAILDGRGKVKEILSVATDITERKRAEDALAKSEGELRFLSSRLLSAQEEERKRIAAELHDGLGGSLSAIKISLENTRVQLEKRGADPGLLETPIAWTQHLIDEARRLMRELRPTILDDFGAIVAVKWLLDNFRETYPKIRIEEEIAVDEEEIPEMLKTVIFRITQEAFHNMAKYSKTEFARLSLLRGNGLIELTIADKGDGFDLEEALSKASERRGLGLTSMKERCELSGGTFEIASSIGKGTIVRSSWPIGTLKWALPSDILKPVDSK